MRRFINLGRGSDDYLAIYVIAGDAQPAVVEIAFEDIDTGPLGSTVIGPTFEPRTPAR